MVTQKVKTWDVLQEHLIAKELDTETKLALLCEYTDLYDELQGMTLGDFIDGYFASDEVEEGAEATDTTEAEADAAESNDNGEVVAAETGDESVVRPSSMVGQRVVYRFPGQNVLSDKTGVTRDSNGTVAFTDVDGESWSNVARERVFPISPGPKYNHVIHVIPRQAREIEGWLSGTSSKTDPEGAVLRNMTVEFDEHPDKITLVIMNGKKPFVDRFVGLPNNGFEDDQKPTTRLFGEHCFWVRKKAHIVEVVTP